MDITIPEALLLLALDDAHGTPLIDDATLRTAVAASAAAQLLLDRRLRIAGDGEPGAQPGTLVAGSGATDARLEPLVERIAGMRPPTALRAIAGLGGKGSPGGKVRERLLDDFERAGVLAREQDRFLGMTWRERWERGERTEIEDAVQARARAVLEGVDGRGGAARADAASADGRPADDPVMDAALAILHGAKALPKVFPDLPEEALERRGAALAEGSWASAEVRAALESIQAAMTTVMLTTAILPAATRS